MKVIFECETELGKCDSDRVNGHFGDDPGDWVGFAFTTAAMTSATGMLRIEQRCYLRAVDRPDEVRSQNWVRPELTLEPVLASKVQTRQLVQELHESYVRKAWQSFVEQSVLSPPLGVAP